MFGLHSLQHFLPGLSFGLGRIESEFNHVESLFEIGQELLHIEAVEITDDTVGCQDDQAALLNVGKGHHLILGCRIAVFFAVTQARGVAVVSVRDDTALITHHVHDLPYVVFGGDGKETMSHILLIDEADERLGVDGFFHDRLGDLPRVFIEHEDQTEIRRRGLLQIEPVDHRFAQKLFVRLDDGAEFFEFAQRDETMPLVSDSGQLKILHIRVDGLGRVLFQHAIVDPIGQIGCGPGILVILAVIRGIRFAFDNTHKIVGIFLIELLLLIGADYIVRRSHTIADIPHNARIKPKCFERLNLHIYLSRSVFRFSIFGSYRPTEVEHRCQTIYRLQRPG